MDSPHVITPSSESLTTSLLEAECESDGLATKSNFVERFKLGRLWNILSNNSDVATTGCDYEKADETDDSYAISARLESGGGKINAPAKASTSRVHARVISDAIIGISDGMTVPFALAAGLSAIGDNTRIVVFGGFAELIAGAISMGLGGYLGAKSEEDSYKAILKETQNEVSSSSHTVPAKVSEIFSTYEVPSPLIQELTNHISQSSKLSDFLMRFEHGLPAPNSSRAFTSAFTIALGYLLGGLIPLFPYIYCSQNHLYEAVIASVIIMIIALFTFGFCKTCFVSGWRGKENMWKGVSGGGVMIVVGGLAAGSAVICVKAFEKFKS